MAHIKLPPNSPGIIGLIKYRPDTGKLLCDFGEVLLRGDSPLSKADRELIATFVSNRNKCVFSTNYHDTIARHLLEENAYIIDEVINDFQNANISDKMKALLNIADKVRQGGTEVKDEDVKLAKDLGSCDREIHDPVLITALLCMVNRYVDGLGITFPNDSNLFKHFLKHIVEQGYVPPDFR